MLAAGVEHVVSSFDLTKDASQRYERFIAPVMKSFVEALVDHAELQPGSAVLDVACGTGFVARRAAAAVGTTGRVVGLDVNPTMIAMARQTLDASPAQYEWVEASALDMPFGDAEFDATLCQQGIQFMPDRAAALAEMTRVTRVGGKVALTFFTPLPTQPYFAAQLSALTHLLGSPALEHAFNVDPAEVEDGLRAAGLQDTQVETVDGILEVNGPLDEFAWGHALSLPVAAALMTLTPEQRSSFTAEVAAAMEPFASPGAGARIPVNTYLVIGRR